MGRSVLDFLVKRCGLRHLHGSKISWALKNVLLEIDLQHLRDTHPCKSFQNRMEMYSHVHGSLIKQEPIDYLEFGVFQGDSLRYWLDLDKNSRSRFFGFDSFEGLPEQWGPMEKGAFDVGGTIPRIEDERVEFFKGWFNETIPRFACKFSAKNRLVLHLDADLYGSTMLALVHLGPVLRTGTLLFFDEFFAREHEFRALMDWQVIYGRNFRIVAKTADYAQICAELL
jgi:O-methyltransferase